MKNVRGVTEPCDSERRERCEILYMRVLSLERSDKDKTYRTFRRTTRGSEKMGVFM